MPDFSGTADTYKYSYLGERAGTDEAEARRAASSVALMRKEAQVVYRLVPIAIIRPPIDVCEVVELEKK